MSPSQSESGKAFEYAIVCALRAVLGESNITLHDNSAAATAKASFIRSSSQTQEVSVLAATGAVKQLVLFEPNLAACAAGANPLHITMQSDQAGGKGDVRDIIINSLQSNWQIGISAKHQHEALKHSRLSQQIDFGKQWFGLPCSSKYFEEIAPIFLALADLKTQGILWSAVPDKGMTVYVPLLNSFRTELLRLDQEHSGLVAPRMVQYLIGTFDFYKVIKLPDQTKVQVYNFAGSLNQDLRKTLPSMRLDKLRLPSRIVELDYKRDDTGTVSTTTLELVCNGGWQLSFRLHNASSRVEPSLKFDINLVGRPNNLQTFSILPQ